MLRISLIILFLACSAHSTAVGADEQFPRPLTFRYAATPLGSGGWNDPLPFNPTKLAKLVYEIDHELDYQTKVDHLDTLNQMRHRGGIRQQVAAEQMLVDLAESGDLSVQSAALSRLGLDYTPIAQQVAKWVTHLPGGRVVFNRMMVFCCRGSSRITVDKPDQVPDANSWQFPIEMHIPPGARLTPRIVEQLKYLTTLELMTMPSDAASTATIQSLRRALPKCRFRVEHP